LISRGWRVAPLSTDPQLSRTTLNHPISKQSFDEQILEALTELLPEVVD
jgi:hypothetical protein